MDTRRSEDGTPRSCKVLRIEVVHPDSEDAVAGAARVAVPPTSGVVIKARR